MASTTSRMLLVRLMLIVAPVVFAINALTKGNWLDALLFSLSVAVGLTSEMLPMIVTTCLAKGALDLSRGRVVLERHLDALGQTDADVLRHAFLTSHFEMGMLNLVDTAIIDCAHEDGP